ncbi:MAG: GTP-binding protein, partial [Spongiibacteraceae bacterium]|nr:GTP-binding protein [Spongiibacteraceae bacterium]
WKDDETPATQLVFIGKELDADHLQQTLSQALI